VEPLPERSDVDYIQAFPLVGLLFEVVVTPLIANVIREWSVDDVCFPLQIWSIVVVVTAGIALWAFLRMSDKSETRCAKYFTPFLFSWFISGCVLFSNGECGGEIFAFSAYVMGMVSMSTSCACCYWLLQLT